MDAELAALASSGATTMVGLMATDAWTQVRDRVARFFARGHGGAAAPAVEQEHARQLDLSRAELMAAQAASDEETASDIEAEWRTQLRRVLRDDPSLAGELRSLVDELQPQLPQPGSTTVNNAIHGGSFQAPVIQAGKVTGTNFH